MVIQKLYSYIVKFLIICSQRRVPLNSKVGLCKCHYILFDVLHTGTGPGFPVGWGADPLGRRHHKILPKFPNNCMKLRKIWAGEGDAVRRGASLDPLMTEGGMKYLFPQRNNFDCKIYNFIPAILGI